MPIRIFLKSIFILLLLAIAAVVIFVAALIWSYYFDVTSQVEPFSSSSWIELSDPYEGTNDPGCVRGGMALDLIQKEILKEKTKEQVREILGKPDDVSESKFSYELGQCSGLGWENSKLVIGFVKSSVHSLKIL